MKKLFFVFAFVLMGAVAMAQSQKVYVDGKLSTKEVANNIPASQIASMSRSVEDGVAVTRIVLKKGDSIAAVKPMEINAAGGVAAALSQVYEKTTLLKVGAAAADFTGQKYSGGELKLSDYKGKVILLNFWATWCAPCLNELAPEGLPTVLAKFAGNADFVFLPAAYTNSKEQLDAFFATENGKTIYSYLSPITIMDPDKAIFSLYATRGVPRSFVIGKDGKIVLGSLGASPEELAKIEAAIADALNK